MHFLKQFLYVALLFLSSCSPSSQEDFFLEGEGKSRSLVQILNKVHSREDLLKIKNILKKEFTSLAKTAIQAKKFQQKHSSILLEAEYGNEPVWGNRLKEELSRIYQLEDGRDIIESLQKEAIEKLDLFEKELRLRSGEL